MKNVSLRSGVRFESLRTYSLRRRRQDKLAVAAAAVQQIEFPLNVNLFLIIAVGGRTNGREESSSRNLAGNSCMPFSAAITRPEH